MSLLDYFAEQALMGISGVLYGGIRPDDLPGLARDCYGIAEGRLPMRQTDIEAKREMSDAELLENVRQDVRFPLWPAVQVLLERVEVKPERTNKNPRA